MWGPHQAQWLERLDLEHDNLRAALEWCRAQGDDDAMLRMAAALVRFWDIRGHVAEGRRWLDLAIGLARGPATPARARALIGAAYLAVLQGDLPSASALLQT